VLDAGAEPERRPPIISVPKALLEHYRSDDNLRWLLSFVNGNFFN
jgi:hypothetical protein